MSTSRGSRNVVRTLLLAALGLILLAASAAFLMVEWGVTSAKKRAQSRFHRPDAAVALIEMVECASCSMEHRNEAVWALGQLRDSRALDILKSHFHGGECRHETQLCQHELRKAIRRIEARS